MVDPARADARQAMFVAGGWVDAHKPESATKSPSASPQIRASNMSGDGFPWTGVACQDVVFVRRRRGGITKDGRRGTAVVPVR